MNTIVELNLNEIAAIAGGKGKGSKKRKNPAAVDTHTSSAPVTSNSSGWGWWLGKETIKLGIPIGLTAIAIGAAKISSESSEESASLAILLEISTLSSTLSWVCYIAHVNSSAFVRYFTNLLGKPYAW
jgi:hypothetical protein